MTDVAITVPGVGAYFAGPVTTARGYCPSSTPTGPTTEANVFYPLADTPSVSTDRIASTNDGKHILGATVTTLNDLHVTIPVGACPATGGLTFTSSDSPSTLSQTTVGGDPDHRDVADFGFESSSFPITCTPGNRAGSCYRTTHRRPGRVRFDNLHQTLRHSRCSHRGRHQRRQHNRVRGNLRRQPGPPHQPEHIHRLVDVSAESDQLRGDAGAGRSSRTAPAQDDLGSRPVLTPSDPRQVRWRWAFTVTLSPRLWIRNHSGSQ